MDGLLIHRSSFTARFAVVAITLALLTQVAGCSMFVMAGKALFGDPKVASQFKSATGEDLTETDQSIVIICSAPHAVTSHHPSIQIDMVDRVSSQLELAGIKVVDSGDVASWFDDHGEWGDYTELAREFDAGYVLHIKLRSFEHVVPNSETLLQGKAQGDLTVHRVENQKSITTALTKRRNDFVPVTNVFDRDFSLQFPTSYPVPRETRSEDNFLQGFVDRTALHIAQHFYDYRMSDSVH